MVDEVSQDEYKRVITDSLHVIIEDIESWGTAPFKAQKDITIGHLYEVMRLISQYHENGVRK